MIHLGTVPASTTVYIPFSTYAGSTGASVTCSGLAVTDIEIYKDGSTTQRASDAGISLLDTDGIDFDGITGLHGFSIDLSDNTDASFYAVGSFYWVVVSAITVDSQTVTFLAATFRIGPAESIAGYPKVDQHALQGDAQSATDLKDFADAGYDPATNKVQGVVLVDTTTTNTDMRGTDSAATAASLATAQADLDILTGVDGVTLATLQANYAPAKAGDAMALTTGERSSTAAAFAEYPTALCTSPNTVGRAIVLGGNPIDETTISGSSTPTSTVMRLNAGPASANALIDHTIFFISGDCAGESKIITAYTGSPDYEVTLDEALTTAPTAADQVSIGKDHTHSTSSIATSVTADMDANSTKLAAIEADTQDLQTQIGAAGAGLTGIPKTGYKLASDGLDVIDATIPSAVATTFPGFIKQIWARFFYKSTLSSTELITYASDGTTVVTTQTASDNGTLQTQGKAS